MAYFAPKYCCFMLVKLISVKKKLRSDQYFRRLHRANIRTLRYFL